MDKRPSERSALFQFLPILALIALFVWAHAFTGSVSAVLEYNADEGFNLMKAKLLSMGFSLYSDIWSDQPPLYSHILNLALSLTDWRVEYARLLQLSFSCVLVLAFYYLLLPDLGWLRAALAGLFLLLSASYYWLSVSVMIGLPSIAFAMLSLLACFKSLRQDKPSLMLLSGLAAGLSLTTKLITLPIFAALLLALLRRKALSLKFSLYGFAGLVPALLLVLGFTDFSALLEQSMTHVKVSANADLVHPPSVRVFLAFASHHENLLALAVLGFIFSFRERDLLSTTFRYWLAFAFVALLKHFPIWSHHFLLLSPALSYFAARSLLLPLRVVADGPIRLSVYVFALIAPRLIAQQLYATTSLHDNAPSAVFCDSTYGGLRAAFSERADQTDLIVSDRPILAFLLGRATPPEIAVTSFKRIASGQLDSSAILKIIKERKITQVILAERFPSSMREEIRDELKGRFDLVYNRGKYVYLQAQPPLPEPAGLQLTAP